MPHPISELMNFDPIAEAMRQTGGPRDSDETIAIGSSLMQMKEDNLVMEMGLRDDTYFMSDFNAALRIFRELGFSEVLRYRHINAPEGFDETLEWSVIFWKEGVLGYITSLFEQEIDALVIYYNWESGDTWEKVGNPTGHIHQATLQESGRRVLIGHSNGVVGLRHILGEMAGSGRFLPIWLEQPLMRFADPHDEWTAGVMDRLPLEVQTAINPKIPHNRGELT